MLIERWETSKSWVPKCALGPTGEGALKWPPRVIWAWRRAGRAERKVASESWARGKEDDSQIGSQARKMKAGEQSATRKRLQKVWQGAKSQWSVRFRETRPPPSEREGWKMGGKEIKKWKKWPFFWLSLSGHILTRLLPWFCPYGVGVWRLSDGPSDLADDKIEFYTKSGWAISAWSISENNIPLCSE